MVGKAVLLECLDDAKVDEVLVINRSPLDMTHPKLKEMLLKDFTTLGEHNEGLEKYDACFFCMGVSSVGMDEKTFTQLTHTIATSFAAALYEKNSKMIFNYVSGVGTDSMEKGRVMWARVKGRTENDLMNMGFKAAYMFRPGMIIPERGIKSRTNWYQAMYVISRPLFPLLKKMKSVVTTTMVGKAMIATLDLPETGPILHPKEIRELGA